MAAILTLALGILLGVLAGRDGDGGEGGPAGTALPSPTLAVALPDIRPAPALLERAEVVGIIDGDTIDVELDGREAGVRRERVRYYGVDTPERGDRCYREAKERNEALAAEAVLLLPDVRDRDRSGRLLRYAFDEQGGSIDARLIAEGLALAWPEDGTYRDELLALEEEARAAEVGCLWGE